MIATLTQLNPGNQGPIQVPSVAWGALLPFLILVGGALVLVVYSSLIRGRAVTRTYAPFASLVAVAAGISAIPMWLRVQDPHRGPFSTAGGTFGVDGFSVFLTFVMCASVVLASLATEGYLDREHLVGPEAYVLMLLSASGGVIMASANDLILVFLGLEILSIAVYVLAGMHLRRTRSGEAALKYFIIGSFSSAIFLYGVALVYGATGSSNLVKIHDFLASNVLTSNGLLLAGIVLLLVGFGYKIAAVPFHVWTPDVYQGSPTPAVAYMASGVKVAGFAGLLRVFFLVFPTYQLDWQPIIYALAIISMVVGAVLAIVQTDVKRMLAYSSINHAGFILVGLEAATKEGVSAALFYLAAYTFMVAGSFAVIAVISRRGDNHTDIRDYRGLARRQPVLAFLFTLLLLAQAGVPFTVGFIAKFYVIVAAARAHSYWLALAAMVIAVISAYLYLRIVLIMYAGETPEQEAKAAGPRYPVPWATGLAVGLAVAYTIVFGIVPGPITHLTVNAIPHLVALGK